MRSILVFLFAAAIAGCYQLTLEPSDFAWPIETVLNVDEEGFVREERFSFSTNVIPLFTEETGDSLAFNNAEVRIIRDEKGYYYLTSNGFKNVYLFNAEDGKLVLKSRSA